MNIEEVNLQSVLMKRNGYDLEAPILPLEHAPGTVLVKSLIEGMPCPEARQRFTGQLLIQTARGLFEALESTQATTDARLAANPSEVRLDLSHVVFRR